MHRIFNFCLKALIVCLLNFNSAAYAQRAQEYSIDYLTIDSGLPQNEVTAIIQDKKGFLWFGTRGGLARYDGHNMKVFQYEPGSSNSLSNNSIETLFEDSHGKIWIGTKSGGMNYFDPFTESFTTYQSVPNDTSTISGNRVVSLQEDNDGYIWAGTWKNGLNRFDPKSKKFKRFLQGMSVLCLKRAPDGTLWISGDNQLYKKSSGSNKIQYFNALKRGADITSLALAENGNLIHAGGWGTGLITFNLRASGQPEQIFHDPKNIKTISANSVYSLLVDQENHIWAGFWGGGLNVIDNERNVKRFELTGPSGQSVSDYQIVLSIFQDKSGIVWIGTDGGGICKIQEAKNYFVNYNTSNSSLSNGHILSILQDSKNKVWIGTKAGGINTIEQHKVTPHNELFDQLRNSDINVVYTIYEDLDSTIWFGTPIGLHKVISHSSNRIQSAQLTLQPGASINRKVMAILMDRKGRLWAGTQQHGLYCAHEFRKGNSNFKNYLPSPANIYSLSDTRISCLFQDSNDRIWIGTYKGLYFYDEKNDRFIGILHVHGDVESLSNDIINCVNEDANGNLWVGTPGGLNKITVLGEKIRSQYYTKKDGLPNDYINAILFDDKQNLWISSNGGIFEFNPKNKLIKVFTKQDGLQSNAFCEGAAFKGKDALMYFGGINGLNVFNPSNIPPPTPSPLVFVSLKLMNKEVNPGDTVNEKIILERSITFTNEITLSHLEKVISLEVSSVDFTSPEKNQYSFKLEGFDDGWVNKGNSKSITYTNLKPGTYTLYAKASDVGNIWNDNIIALTIQVLPAPWLTGWAYLGYAAITALIIIVIVQNIRKRIQLKNELHAAQVVHTRTQLERDKEKEISEMKLRFFTNVSHELRTPLTLISSPLEEMLALGNLPSSVKERLALIHRHTNRLLALVNQLLDFRKTESGNLQLFIEQTEIVTYTTTIFESFRHVAARRNINYSFHSDLNHLLIEVDRNKIEIAVTNIISNAFKYSPDGSEIRCYISIEKDIANNKIYCLIQIEDTGCGIPKDVRDKIFDLYYQVSVSESMKVTGSGIGLSLVKEVVQLHGGEVAVSSEPGKGSVFTIKLPIKQSPRLSIISVSRDVVLQDPTLEKQVADDLPSETFGETEKPVVLVIEDTDELRNYLFDYLSNSFIVISAANAKIGLKTALSKIPDLVVSDIMMQEMDGFELCQSIKTNEKTSHIPVILLTAKVMPEDELLGLKNGADDYIKKPFVPSILTARIKRQLEARKQLREYYSRKVTLQPTNIEITPYDEKFLKKAMAFIENNLLNPEFHNECLEKELGMSHSTLYRKLKALTGLSIHEFIRSIRLKRAAQLLESGSITVSEAAYQTGFSEMKYFRLYFKNQFGCLPSEYLKMKSPHCNQKNINHKQ